MVEPTPSDRSLAASGNMGQIAAFLNGDHRGPTTPGAIPGPSAMDSAKSRRYIRAFP